jgi:hypothetical protein
MTPYTGPVPLAGDDESVEVTRFPAVSVVAADRCCHAARLLQGVRLLAAEATQLPLPECTMPGECRCRFEWHSDRRANEEDRRGNAGRAGEVRFPGGDRRRSSGRRGDDR